MLKSIGKITAVSAATLALLAGCGNDRASSDAGSAHNLKGPALKAPATEPAVSDSSISGELLASLLLVNTYIDGRYPIYFLYSAEPWDGPVPGGSRQIAARTGVVHGYQRAPIDQKQLQIHSSQRDQYLEAYLASSRRFTYLDLNLPMTVTENEITRPNRPGYILKPSTTRAADTLLIELGTQGEARSTRTYTPPDPGSHVAPATWEEPAKTVALKSAGVYRITAGARIPLYRGLHRWQDAQGNFSEILLLRGDYSSPSAQDVRLCFNTHAPDVKRLICSVWYVPTGWKAGDSLNEHYKGIYVVDDRSAQPGESGLQYWQTPVYHGNHSGPVGFEQPRPPESPMGETASEAISHGGINGDVLATMLTQNTIARTSEGERIYQTAFPWTAAVPSGQAIPNGNSQAIRGGQTLGFPRRRQSEPLQLLLTTYRPPESETLTYPEADIFISMSARTRRPVNESGPPDRALAFSADLSTGTELLNLGHNVMLTSPRHIMLHPQVALSIRKSQFLPFNQGLHRWGTDGGHFMEMLLLRGARPDQARLCFNFHVPTIKRLLCQNWQVPAGWQLGQPLVSRGMSVIDDRSVHDGESGLRYWQTEALN